AGWFVVALVAAVGAFLLWQAVPALARNDANFLLERVWQPAGAQPRFGIADLLYVTVVSSILAMALAVPVAVAVALYLTQYAPRRLARPAAYVVDLLAAVPSIVYGLWGYAVLRPRLQPVEAALQNALGWVPVLRGTTVTGTVFVASVVLAIMILPIVTAVSREIFTQAPVTHREAALALGATRWEMIRTAVLPFGRAGVVSATMLGLGRALGETIAVTIILSRPNANDAFNPSIFSGGETFASRIANSAAEFDSPQKTGAYISAGLVLFALTFAVNGVARAVVARRREF
ncbi:MAG: phosphate ABC transporter permease subunit PstC, partial [Actinomycetota bacterium]|nr:phosphate ABC transporter permease subunit PstC [Actinomycetota bacterium]